MCDTQPWQECTSPSSTCCGAVDGWACRLTSCPHILPAGDCAQTHPAATTPEHKICQPPHGGPYRGWDERLFASWGAKGVDDFNGSPQTRHG